MNKKACLLKIVGILFIFLPLGINIYTIFRMMSSLLGILLLSLGILLSKKNSILRIIFYPILIFALVYGIDFICVRFLSRIPVYSYQFISSETVSTYDSLFYRIYNCNEQMTLDPFYQKNYVCEEEVGIEEINSFLSNIASNYKKYRYSFVTVKGKISEVSGDNYLVLQTYEQKENNMAGQITFNKDTSLVIENNNKDLRFYENYEIYDNVLVTGRIVKLEKSNTIIMHDAKIISTDNFDDFEINVVNNKNCEVDIKELAKVNDYAYYTSCLSSVYVVYKEENIYDLKFALETKKMTWEKLIKEGLKEENEIAEIYKFDTYNILKCRDSNNVIIGDQNLSLTSRYCESIVNISKNDELEGI